MVAKNFSNLIKAKRELRNLSQQDLANMCGMTRATIMHIESGNQRVFLEQALKIASALAITTEELRTVFEMNGEQLNFPLEFT